MRTHATWDVERISPVAQPASNNWVLRARNRRRDEICFAAIHFFLPKALVKDSFQRAAANHHLHNLFLHPHHPLQHHHPLHCRHHHDQHQHLHIYKCLFADGQVPAFRYVKVSSAWDLCSSHFSVKRWFFGVGGYEGWYYGLARLVHLAPCCGMISWLVVR